MSNSKETANDKSPKSKFIDADKRAAAVARHPMLETVGDVIARQNAQKLPKPQEKTIMERDQGTQEKMDALMIELYEAWDRAGIPRGVALVGEELGRCLEIANEFIPRRDEILKEAQAFAPPTPEHKPVVQRKELGAIRKLAKKLSFRRN